jgi:hypothetical protein
MKPNQQGKLATTAGQCEDQSGRKQDGGAQLALIRPDSPLHCPEGCNALPFQICLMTAIAQQPKQAA